MTSVNKIITKVLLMRLGDVLGDTIFENQSVLVPSRQILEACLVANELVEDLKCRTQKGSILKLDFEKAYVRVN